MSDPRVLILRAPGVNCDAETEFAFQRAGALTERLHVERLLEKPKLLGDFQVLCIPGGFSYGDDLSAGRVLGSQLQSRLADALLEFKTAGKLILGICNGFQVLLKTGLLLQERNNAPTATLAWNASGRFQDRWVHLAVAADRCVFLSNIERMYLPIAHAEGRFVARDAAALESLRTAGQIALRYCAADGEPAYGFPENPNGATDGIAGVCDETGRVFGLMPHPERHIERTHHPRWTRGEGQDPGDGLAVFKNAVRYCR
jgi:phosphoribosylformylglycinamidine synthase I